MNNTIQTFWVGDRLSVMEKLCLHSLVEHNDDVHLYVYHPLEGIPSQVEVKDANEIIDESKVFRLGSRGKLAKGSYAAFADWFRCELLLRKGGFWVDMDVLCLKSFDFEEESVFGYQNGGDVCNAVFKQPPNSPVMKHMRELCLDPTLITPWDRPQKKRLKLFRKLLGDKDYTNVPWGWVGPKCLTGAVYHYELDRFIQPMPVFFPVPPKHWRSLVDKDYEPLLSTFITDKTFAIHLWNERFRQNEYPKDGPFGKGSLLDKLVEKYQISYPAI